MLLGMRREVAARKILMLLQLELPKENFDQLWSQTAKKRLRGCRDRSDHLAVIDMEDMASEKKVYAGVDRPDPKGFCQDIRNTRVVPTQRQLQGV